MPNNILTNHPFCSFASFLIASLTPFINKLESLRVLTIFMISFISSLGTPNFVKPEKAFLANDLSAFSIKDNAVFSNGPHSLPNNTIDCTVLEG